MGLPGSSSGHHEKGGPKLSALAPSPPGIDLKLSCPNRNKPILRTKRICPLPINLDSRKLFLKSSYFHGLGGGGCCEGLVPQAQLVISWRASLCLHPAAPGAPVRTSGSRRAQDLGKPVFQSIYFRIPPLQHSLQRLDPCAARSMEIACLRWSTHRRRALHGAWSRPRQSQVAMKSGAIEIRSFHMLGQPPELVVETRGAASRHEPGDLTWTLPSSDAGGDSESAQQAKRLATQFETHTIFCMCCYSVLCSVQHRLCNFPG